MSNDKNQSVWIRPQEVMALHRLKMKKKALQARMNRSVSSSNNTSLSLSSSLLSSQQNASESSKRKNPFVQQNQNKRPKSNETNDLDLTESSDNTLFKLLHSSNTIDGYSSTPVTSFTNILRNSSSVSSSSNVVKQQGEKWIPIDWSLKSKLRLISPKPFAWNRTLKTSEEASGITGFVRCLDTRVNTSLDTSPNAQFHQCCLYWQHPSLPWLQLFPRAQGKVSATVNTFTTSQIKDSLHTAWTDSFRSLFQLVRARQCPYFYMCANTFTACFRAAGICGNSEMHVILTPTTRGFRQLLRQEDISYTMPLKNKRQSLDSTVDQGYDTLDQTTSESSHVVVPDSVPLDEENDEDEPSDEIWLESMGVNAEEIKKINNTQARIKHRNECEVDNSEESLIYVEGVEAHGLYNLLINCKSIIAISGPLAGVPPTLLSPVAFHGASLQSLKVRENKIRNNNSDYYSIELSGPILPTTVHNLYSLLKKDCNITTTFANLSTTAPFSKITTSKLARRTNDGGYSNTTTDTSGSVAFGQENLSDCGLNKEILKHFCSANPDHIQHYDSLKFNHETGLYIWI